MGEPIVEEWPVSGMVCGGCAASIEKSLVGTAGLRSVKADVDAGLVRLEMVPGLVDLDDVRSRIQAAGFVLDQGG